MAYMSPLRIVPQKEGHWPPLRQKPLEQDLCELAS